MNDRTYHLIAGLIRLSIWQGWQRRAHLENAGDLPASEPAIFISNHANALGPIGCVSEIPLRLYPWTRPEMLDLRTNPDYMRGDFVEKDMRLRPPLSAWVAVGLSRLVVPLLNGVGCIPAFQAEQILEKRTTVKQSLARLREGRCLLVFPEMPDWPLDPRSGMRRFSRSVLWLAVLFHRETGERLPIYPVCVHPSHRIRLGKAMRLGKDELGSPAQRQAWIETLEDTIRGMYLDLEAAAATKEERQR